MTDTMHETPIASPASRPGMPGQAPVAGRVPVVRMSGRGLPDAGRLQDLLGDGAVVVGAPRSAEVVVLGSPSLSDVRLTVAEQPGSTVVVLLTAEADSNALVAAYEAGADLVVRGAESRELAARVRALLRRRAVRDGHAA